MPQMGKEAADELYSSLTCLIKIHRPDGPLVLNALGDGVASSLNPGDFFQGDLFGPTL
jgi:hypothetical protein